MRRGECVEREEVLLGVFHQPADLRDSRLQVFDDLDHALARLAAVLGGEQLPEGR